MTVSSVYVYEKRVQDRLRDEIVLLNYELDSVRSYKCSALALQRCVSVKALEL